MLSDFLERLPDAVKELAERNCRAQVDQKEYERFKSPFLVRLLRSPAAKEIMIFLAVKPGITPGQRAEETYTEEDQFGPSIFIGFQPGELTPEGILNRVALGLVATFCQKIIGFISPPAQGAPPSYQLLEEINAIAKMIGSLETSEDGRYVLREEHKIFLRELLGSGSIIDPRYLIEALEKYQHPGQYL